jgi:hypothetical protein
MATGLGSTHKVGYGETPLPVQLGFVGLDRLLHSGRLSRYPDP